jgi:uncharacterized protein (DUF3084 family)
MALSALTAYYADIAGRWLGKRRKTMFGWRPKRTAAVIITGAGALIALLSFLILLVADAGIRRALLHWDQTVQQLDDARKETKELAAETEQLRAGRQAQERKLTDAQANLERSQAAVARAEVAVTAAEAKVAARQTELQRVQSSLGAAHASLSEAKQRLTQTHGQLDTAKSDLRVAARDLAERRKEVVKAERIVFQAGAQSLRAWNEAYAARRIADQAQSGQLVARRDEELARSVIPPLATLSSAREELATTLNKARALVSARAQERGVQYGENAKFIRVTRKVLRVRGASADKDKVEEYLLPEQIIRDAVANSLMVGQSPRPGGVVLQVVATANTVAGETVPVDFRLFENHLIFDRGEVIGTVVIDASESKENIIKHITDELTHVRQTAIAKGLMPASDNSVSSLSLTEIADAYNTVLDRIQVYRQPKVPVDVVVQRDTWTAGPLDLKLSVRTYYDGGS